MHPLFFHSPAIPADLGGADGSEDPLGSVPHHSNMARFHFLGGDRDAARDTTSLRAAAEGQQRGGVPGRTGPLLRRCYVGIVLYTASSHDPFWLCMLRQQEDGISALSALTYVQVALWSL